MEIAWWIVLPLSVWVSYTADHLMDARRLGEEAHTERHLFHARHFGWIAPLWAVALLFCMIFLPFFLPSRVVLFGIGMGILVLIHLGLVRLIGSRVSRLFQKEFGVGVIYSLGIWGGPLAMQWPDIPGYIWVLLLQFFLLVMMNLLLFSFFEYETDALDGHTSFVRAIGRQMTRFLVLGLGLIVLLAGGLLLASEPQAALAPYQLIYLLMSLMLAFILRNEKRFSIDEAYRTLGDAVFLLPGLVVFL
jgi:4-hydroxybenzoate polyprenyltransferase